MFKLFERKENVEIKKKKPKYFFTMITYVIITQS